MERNINKEKAIIGQIELLANDLSEELAKKTENSKLIEMFKCCFLNTAKTTMQCDGEDEVFLITGDIEAMWLRDSSAQVCHYLAFANRYSGIKDMIAGLIKKQFKYISLDPYANAFNPEPNGKCWTQDKSDATGEQRLWEWERKYELDSLCYPVRLLWQYFEITKDENIFSPQIIKTLKLILRVFRIEQQHGDESGYFFERENCPVTDTLLYGGKGTPVGYTGMIWSGFRPSDDACKYGYLIPANLFAAEVLGYIENIGDFMHDVTLMSEAKAIREEVMRGIEQFGVIKNPSSGEEMYAYEVDGRGNYNLMDDANVPNLLGIPWYTSIQPKDKRYQVTRKFVLSPFNPYYFVGDYAMGIGSPHTFQMYIWPIGLCIQGLTSISEKEKLDIMDILINTDAGTGLMHESFDVNFPEQYSREWFAWANSLFALFVMDTFKLYS